MKSGADGTTISEYTRSVISKIEAGWQKGHQKCLLIVKKRVGTFSAISMLPILRVLHCQLTMSSKSRAVLQFCRYRHSWHLWFSKNMGAANSLGFVHFHTFSYIFIARSKKSIRNPWDFYPHASGKGHSSSELRDSQKKVCRVKHRRQAMPQVVLATGRPFEKVRCSLRERNLWTFSRYCVTILFWKKPWERKGSNCRSE